MRPAHALLLSAAAALAALVAGAAPKPDLGRLRFTVALFRHGIRVPLKGFDDTAAHAHSGGSWPTLAEWGASDWGDLTKHGGRAAAALGEGYARHYRQASRAGFSVYLWADVDTRTRATARALGAGLTHGGASVTVDGLPEKTTADPLFHPFKAGCATPDGERVSEIAAGISRDAPRWADLAGAELDALERVLACRGVGCTPLRRLEDAAKPCTDLASCSSPVKWTGRIPYASSATEAFLLAYANGMAHERIGWGRVFAEAEGSRSLRSLVTLHEVSFDHTEREPYLAKVQGSNLVRELVAQLDRAAGRPLPGGACPRGPADARFVGLVGHDTNLANVGALLGIDWTFDDARAPRPLTSESRWLPASHALPAGALVLDLYEKDGGSWSVRVLYETQSLKQMRRPDGRDVPYRLTAACRAPDGRYRSPCELTLEEFEALAARALGTDAPFLCQCGPGSVESTNARANASSITPGSQRMAAPLAGWNGQRAAETGP